MSAVTVIEPNPEGNLPPLSELLSPALVGRPFLCQGPYRIPNEQIEYDPAGHLRALIDELATKTLDD